MLIYLINKYMKNNYNYKKKANISYELKNLIKNSLVDLRFLCERFWISS